MSVQYFADALIGVNVISSPEVKHLGQLLGLTDSLVTQRRAGFMATIGFHIFHNPNCHPMVMTDKRRWWVAGESVNLYVRDTVQDRIAAVAAYRVQRETERPDRRSTRHGYDATRLQRIRDGLRGIDVIRAGELAHRILHAGIVPFKTTQQMSAFMARNGFEVITHPGHRGGTLYRRYATIGAMTQSTL